MVYGMGRVARTGGAAVVLAQNATFSRPEARGGPRAFYPPGPRSAVRRRESLIFVIARRPRVYAQVAVRCAPN